jgi:hypothetical protein
MKTNEENENLEGDELVEYLEYLTRMVPTTLPEWMD